MPRWLNITIQAVALAGTAVAGYGALLPPRIAGGVYLGSSLAQAIVGVLAHHFNPDGTPAALPYRKD